MKQRVESFGRRLGERGVRAGIVAPSLTGYRVLQEQGLEAYCREDGGAEIHIRREGGRLPTRLPENIEALQRLSTDVPGKLAFSYRDVPSMAISNAIVATIPNAYLLCGPNEWGNESFAVLGADKTRIAMEGMEYSSVHAELIRNGVETDVFDKAVLVMRRSFRNYFLWHTFVLPRIALIPEELSGHTLLMPSKDRMTPFMTASLREIWKGDIDHNEYRTPRLIRVRSLVVAECDPYFRPALASVARTMSGPLRASRGRKIYISRATAPWRKLINEEEIVSVLEGEGFEAYRFEALDYRKQVELMAEADVVVGLHGAGLANILFCPPGSDVVEISNPQHPNAHFYALALAMGPRYWLMHGKPEGTVSPVYQDMWVDPATLRSTLGKISQGVTSA